ncbi:hypothetical protein C8R47DRAFT_1221734 [Mycena vitilis]|nr:hypothetical protein C8R47DRAFT_1221734 [Mycena vitilis]
MLSSPDHDRLRLRPRPRHTFDLDTFDLAFTVDFDPHLHPRPSIPPSVPSTSTPAPTLTLHLRHSPHPPTFFKTLVTFDPLFFTGAAHKPSLHTSRRPCSTPPKRPALNTPTLSSANR